MSAGLKRVLMSAEQSEVSPWFDSPAEALSWIRKTAEGICDREVDPHWGANHIWNTALGKRIPLDPLRPLIDAGDQLDQMDRSDPRRKPLEADIRKATRELLDNSAFWSKPV